MDRVRSDIFRSAKNKKISEISAWKYAEKFLNFPNFLFIIIFYLFNICIIFF